MKVKIEVAAGISALISFLECRCHSGFGPPQSISVGGFGPGSGPTHVHAGKAMTIGENNCSGIGPLADLIPLRSLDPIPNFPVKHRLHHIW